MNSLQGKRILYSVTIPIDSIRNRPNSLYLTKYCSYLLILTIEAIPPLSMTKLFGTDRSWLKPSLQKPETDSKHSLDLLAISQN